MRVNCINYRFPRLLTYVVDIITMIMLSPVLSMLCFRNRILHTLEIIRLLIDSGVRYIRPTLDTGFLLAEHYETLTNILRQNNCVGLNTIFIKVIFKCKIYEYIRILRCTILILPFVIVHGYH